MGGGVHIHHGHGEQDGGDDDCLGVFDGEAGGYVEVPVGDVSHGLEVTLLVFGAAGSGRPEELVAEEDDEGGHEGEGGQECEDDSDGESETHDTDDLEVADHHGSESDHDCQTGGEDGFSRPHDGLFAGIDVLASAASLLAIPGEDEDTVVASRTEHGGQKEHLHDVEDVQHLSEEEQGAHDQGIGNTNGDGRGHGGNEGPEEQSYQQKDQEDRDGLDQREIFRHCLARIIRNSR